MAAKPKPSRQDKVRSVAHLADGVFENLAHAKRHANSLTRATTTGSKQFNKEHLNKHINDATSHAKKLKAAVNKAPSVKKELNALKKARG